MASQDKKQIDSLKIAFFKLSADIMQSFNIPIRDTATYDGYLPVTINDTIPYFQAQFAKDGFYWYGDKRQEFYRNPRIELSRDLFTILNKQQFVPDELVMKAETIFLHEIVHYMEYYEKEQSIYFKPNVGQDSLYFSQPDEFNAFAVAGVFYLNFVDKATITSILGKDEEIDVKKKRIIDALITKMYPSQKPIFFKNQ